MSIFDKRVAFKPFEYPEVLEYKNAINHSYWLVSEWNFISDIHDFAVNLSDTERNAIKNALLAISQIEVSVKKFWTKLGDRFPKAEFEQIGVTFGESEVRHADAYSHLLQVLNLNEDFTLLLENPVIQGRVDYLTKYLKGASENSNESFTLILTLFSIFIENVSLFSQFVIIKSFNKYKNLLKDVDNVVQATMKEETIHALVGMKLVNVLREEYPELFDADLESKILTEAEEAFKCECKIIDWILGDYTGEKLNKDILKEFIKDRLNESLKQIGYKPIFDTLDQTLLDQTEWFVEDVLGETSTDFFHSDPVNYVKNHTPISEEDLF